MKNLMEKIFLHAGDVVVSQGPASLETILGSCVSVCMWDSTCGMGGMNHIMLPTENNNGIIKPTMYAHEAVDVLLEKLQALGCQIKNLKAKVFGGGIAIKELSQCFNVGVLNVEAAITRRYIRACALCAVMPARMETIKVEVHVKSRASMHGANRGA